VAAAESSSDGALAQQSFARLIELVAARTPTPGGGSAAALAGAIGAALGCMAVRFSMKRKDAPEGQEAVLGALESGLVAIAAKLQQLATDDAAAFESVRTARKLPQGSDTERAAREKALAEANDRSAAVPLATTKLCREALELVEGGLSAFNKNLATDAGSGALLLRAAARSAAWNVLVNVVGDASPAAAARRAEVEKLLARCAELESKVASWTDQALVR
jgi:formiminotetrahydrofolate cyclodeaminase